jgi:hypothetical protein
MKKNSTSITIKTLLAGLFIILIIATRISAQGSPYNCYIKNIIQVNPQRISFEIWIESTGTNTLQLNGFEAGINFNYTGLANGGTITASTDMTLPIDKQLWACELSQTSKQIRVLSKLGNIGSPVMPATPGMLIARVLLSNTVIFSPATPNFTWNFGDSDGYKTKTIVLCFVDGDPATSNITNPASQIVSGNPVLGGAPIPTLPQWGMITMATMLLGFGIFYLKV